MMCEACGQKPATVHLTQMLNNEVKKLHLCEACATESGLDVSGSSSIADILLGLGGAREADDQAIAKSCPSCHMSLEDFRKSSRLGCQHCYEAFAEELAPLLDSMHRSLQHVGKTPSLLNTVSKREKTGITNLTTLRRQLKTAIAAESFEDAARIRDQIRAIEAGQNTPPPAAN